MCVCVCVCVCAYVSAFSDYAWNFGGRAQIKPVRLMYPGLLSSCRPKLTKIKKSLVTLSSFSHIYYLNISGTSKALVGAALRLFSGPGSKAITMEKKGIDSASWLLSPSGLQSFHDFPVFFLCFVNCRFLHSEAGVFYYINIETMETQALKSERSTVCVCHFVCVCVCVCVRVRVFVCI